MGDRAAKEALYDAFAAVAGALGNGRRAEIVDVLSQGERSVEEIAGEIGHSVANTSHHLRSLARAGLVTTRKDGTRVHYALASERVEALWRSVRAVAEEHVAGMDRLVAAYRGGTDGTFEPVTRAELRRRLRRGDVVVVDVRPEPEYRAGHIPGARSVPITELQRRLRSLPKDEAIVAYCRGPYCVYADEAVRVMRGRGYDAHRLEDGFPEWRSEGLPVAVGEEG